MSTNNSWDWIFHGLDKFLDVGHISFYTLLHQDLTRSDLVDAFPGISLVLPGRPPDFQEDSNLRIVHASPDVNMILNVYPANQLHLQPCECENCHLGIQG